MGVTAQQDKKQSIQTLNGASAVVECLQRLGVQRAYGIIGTSVVPVITEFKKYTDSIRYISVRHEQVAASMADTEGRITGKPGIAITHSGPGTLNTAISCAIAYKDCSPMILISGAVEKRLMGCDGFVETDHVKVFSPITKAAFRVEEVREIPDILTKAFNIAMTDAKGPVLVEIPESLWFSEQEVNFESCIIPSPKFPQAPAEDIKKLTELLEGARKPVILAGSGLNSQKGNETLTVLVNKLKIPVITTGNGRGAISEAHEFCLGRAGFGGGNPCADYALENADVVIAAGAVVSDQLTYHHSVPLKAKVAIINADEQARRIKTSADVQLFVVGDAQHALSLLLESCPESHSQKWTAWLDQVKKKKMEWESQLKGAAQVPGTPPVPSKIMAALAGLFPKDTIVTAGQGYHLMYASNYLKTYNPRSFFGSSNYGAMGYGFPAALTAQLLHPGKTVVTVLGDGDFLMTVQDVETAVREKLPLKIVVINDDSYRVLLLTQRMALMSEPFGSEHQNPDFVKLAESFGTKGFRIEKDSDIEPVLKDFLNAPGVALLDVLADKADMTPVNLPAVMRMNEEKRKKA